MMAERRGADTKDTLCTQVVCHAVEKMYVHKILVCIYWNDCSGYMQECRLV